MWIVQKINEAIFKPNLGKPGSRESISTSQNSIGVLDIFGFENFEINRSVYYKYVSDGWIEWPCV